MRVRQPKKPKKPRPDFPLFAHQNGQWAKKIKGKLHYFGLWADPNAALNKYLDQKDDLHAGRTPRVKTDGLTIRDLSNRFLTAKKLQVDTGELSVHSWADYHQTCRWVGASLGFDRLVLDLAADDFQRLKAELAKTCGPVGIGNEVQRVRVLFNWAYKFGLIDRPVRFGPEFRRPGKKVMRLHRAAKGPKLFTPQQVRAMIRKSGQPLKTMILLGINCGFGNADVATLPLKAMNLAVGWVDFPRPKTGVMRRCPLWPETVTAIREAIDTRPTPADQAHAGRVFLTQRGGSWAKETSDNPIAKEFAKLLKKLKLHRGTGKGFYTLRHCFETVGGESKDQVAVDAIMGHARDDMASLYRERVSDDRLKAVTDFVRAWLFGAATNV